MKRVRVVPEHLKPEAPKRVSVPVVPPQVYARCFRCYCVCEGDDEEAGLLCGCCECPQLAACMKCVCVCEGLPCPCCKCFKPIKR